MTTQFKRFMLAATALLSVNAHAIPLNVKDFGATGDGKADDAPAIRKAIDAAFAPESIDRSIFFPPGIYRIASTIHLTPQHSGLTIDGARSKTGRSWVPRTTTLIWDGDKDGSIFDVRATKALRVDNIVIDGNNKAGALFRLNSIDRHNKDNSWTKKYGEQATTGHNFNKITLMRAHTGILINDDAYICGDCTSFGDVVFSRLEYGIDARSEQNLCFLIMRPDVGYVKTAFRFNGGGFVEAINVNAHHVDTVFDISKCGINSGVYTINGVRPEQGARTKGKRPVTIKASGEVNITITAMQTTANAIFGKDGDRETPAFIIDSSANVLVLGSQITGAVAQVNGNKNDVPAFITFQNCRFRCFSNPLESIKTTGNAGFRLRDCQITRDGLDENYKYKITGREFIGDYYQAPPQK
jgi:hypothetical protein